MRILATHLFLPHKSNNHRPRSLHLSAFLFYIVVFLLLQSSFRIIKFARPDILGFATNIKTEKLLNLTNLDRAKEGLSPLKLDSELSAAAMAKANDMFSKNYWAHTAPDGTAPWFFFKNAGYDYVFAGENLARDFNDSENVVAAWMASPSHRENILKTEYQDIGFAIVNGRLNGEDTTLVVQLFGTHQLTAYAPKPVIIPPSAAAAALPSVNNPLGVSRQPLINFFTASKNSATFLTVILIGLLTLDGALIFRKKIVRVAGHNLAHIIFLLALLGALWVTSQGVIL